MENRNDILNELKEISPLLAGMQKTNVYTVPAGYFEALANNTILLVKDEESNFLTTIKKQTGDVPHGYFDTLADNILAKVKAQENEEHYPVLDKISKQNIYTVPNGYFQTLSEVVVAKVSQPQTKVVSMGKRNNWFKYAAAAVFTGIVMLGVLKFTSNNTKFDAATEKGIDIAKQNKFDAEFEKVTEEDIIKYLQKDGSDVEAALVAQAIDEKELPSEEEYLLDEKTLDNFLNDINIKDLNN